MKKRLTAYWKIILLLTGIALIFNLIAFSKPFCDWYAIHIYRHIADALGKFFAPVPFSVGEVLMYTGIGLLLLSLILAVILIFLRKKTGYRKFAAHWFKSILMLLCVLLVCQTFEYIIPMRSSVLGIGKQETKEYGFEEICALTVWITDELNATADQIMAQSEKGVVDFPATEDNYPKIEAAMLACADRYPRLEGDYPPIKNVFFPDLIDRLGIGGYTNTLTMEVMHCKYSLTPVYQPVLDAHELAHHKGFYRESEANFIAQIATAESDDLFLRFAGLYDMFYYLLPEFDIAYSEYKDALIASGQVPAFESDFEGYITAMRELFYTVFQNDSLYPDLNSAAEEIIWQAENIGLEIYSEDEHPLDELPAVNEVIEEAANIGWETQDVILQVHNYDGVVLLLLQYYDGILY